MKFGFTLLLLNWSICFTIQAQNPAKVVNKNLNELYWEAKYRLEKFEKFHGHYIQTKNVRMHYLTWGNPKNTVLIWSHGSLLNAYELYNVANKLAKAGYYIIAIDYYGHGLTPIPKHDVSLYHIADDIEFLMNKLAIKKAVIGGFSRGGYISSAFYDAYPDRVLGLILADGGSVAFNTNYHKLGERAVKNQFKDLDEKTHFPWDSTYDTELDAYKSLYDSTKSGNQFRNLVLIKKNNKGKYGIYENLTQMFYMNSDQNFMDLIFRSTKASLFAESMVIVEPKVIYRKLKVPMLIMDPVSENDPFPFEKENEALKRQHPDLIEHHIYPNTEHNILYLNPKEFTSDIIKFLRKVKLYKGLIKST